MDLPFAVIELPFAVVVHVPELLSSLALLVELSPTKYLDLSLSSAILNNLI